jgi:uncharacterized integral membrane protein (TIGR00697 family)
MRLHKEKSQRNITSLIMITITLILVCLISQNRLVSLGHSYVCATIFAYPIFSTMFDIIAETYGANLARNTIYQSIAATIIFATLVSLFAKLPAPYFWHLESSQFNSVVFPLLHNVLMGTIAILAGQYINILVISKLKIILKGRFFALRSVGSSITGDTATFIISLFGFFINKMTIHEILVITITELMIMYTSAFILCLPATLAVYFIKKSDGSTEENQGVKFNPFTYEHQSTIGTNDAIHK